MRFVNYQPAQVIFYNQAGDVVLDEPSLVAIRPYPNPPNLHTADGDIIAMGEDAREAHKTPGHEDVLVGSFLHNNVVADFGLAKRFIRIMVKKFAKLEKRMFIRKPLVALCIPKELTEVEHSAYRALFARIGRPASGRPHSTNCALLIEKTYQEARAEIPKNYSIIVEIKI